MKIVVCGTGYVGLVHAAVCSEYGHQVYAYDNDPEKLDAFASGQSDRIETYVNEPGLAHIIRETLDRYLFFSSDLASIIEGTDAVFMCLPTPPNLDGSTNLTFYDTAADQLAQLLGSSSNPEFLAEGTAVSQARRPDRVVVGCDHEQDLKILRRVYSQFVHHVRIKYIETSPETA